MMSFLSDKLQNLSSREKILLLAATVAVIWTLWNGFINQPLLLQQRQLQKQAAGLKVRLDSNNLVIGQLQAALQNNPAQSAKTKLQTAQSELNRLQQRMHNSGKQFVEPRLMARALRDLLRQNKRLTLIRLESLPVKTLLEIQQHPLVYLHGLNIQFKGDYFATLDYLQTLETLPWHFYWQRIAYQVQDYPQAEVSIIVSTLSFQEEWLGV